MQSETNTAIGKRDRDVMNSTTFKRIANTYNLQNKRVLDIGCGFGEYMQRFGPTSVGITTTPEEVDYGKTVGRDIRFGNVERLAEAIEPHERFDVIWANNIFEHLLSPHAFLVHLKKFANEDTVVILGTPMVPFFPQLLTVKKFSGALASPHVNFFTKKTYELTLQFAGWTPKNIQPFYFSSNLLDTTFAPFAPHLYLTAQNDSSYQYPPKKIKEWENDSLYQDLIQIMNK